MLLVVLLLLRCETVKRVMHHLLHLLQHGGVVAAAVDGALSLKGVEHIGIELGIVGRRTITAAAAATAAVTVITSIMRATAAMILLQGLILQLLLPLNRLGLHLQYLLRLLDLPELGGLLRAELLLGRKLLSVARHRVEHTASTAHTGIHGRHGAAKFAEAVLLRLLMHIHGLCRRTTDSGGRVGVGTAHSVQRLRIPHIGGVCHTHLLLHRQKQLHRIIRIVPELGVNAAHALLGLLLSLLLLLLPLICGLLLPLLLHQQHLLLRLELLLLSQELVAHPLLLVLLELLPLLGKSLLLLRFVPGLHLAPVPSLLDRRASFEYGPLVGWEFLPPCRDGSGQGGETDLTMGSAMAALLIRIITGWGRIAGENFNGHGILVVVVGDGIDDLGAFVLEEEIVRAKRTLGLVLGLLPASGLLSAVVDVGYGTI
mmetsp:Transcript_25060/g.54272  ORF Transcript_25060/g.54272 Transcript_25060/m.54272 type:complete len:428 (-) Transcript_25060:1439-2722(-)